MLLLLLLVLLLLLTMVAMVIVTTVMMVMVTMVMMMMMKRLLHPPPPQPWSWRSERWLQRVRSRLRCLQDRYEQRERDKGKTAVQGTSKKNRERR